MPRRRSARENIVSDEMELGKQLQVEEATKIVSCGASAVQRLWQGHEPDFGRVDLIYSTPWAMASVACIGSRIL